MAVISKERLKHLRQKKIEIRKQQIAKAKAQQEKRHELLNKRRQIILENQDKLKLRPRTQKTKNTISTKSTKLNKQQQLISNIYNNISNHNDNGYGYGSYNYSTGCKSCGG